MAFLALPRSLLLPHLARFAEVFHSQRTVLASGQVSGLGNCESVYYFGIGEMENGGHDVRVCGTSCDDKGGIDDWELGTTCACG